MENRITKYLLFGALAIVWGVLGYQVYKRVEPKAAQVGRTVGGKPVRKHANLDSFLLSEGYDDPFLKASKPVSIRSNPPKIKRPVSNVATKPLLPPKPIQFPDIQYKGTLKLKTGKTVALVAFEGKNIHLRIGEKFGDVLLTGIAEDSIRVRLQKMDRVILKAR
jgi:hypothetical protein